MIKIEDDFLDQKEFNKIQTLVMGDNFGWYFNQIIDNHSDLDKFQFTHIFYRDLVPKSNYLEQLNPIIIKIGIMSLLRIKANLITRTSNIVENKLHSDPAFLEEEKLKQWTTSIFYVNSNNGYTKFEDGTKVESVANRVVTFPANMKHTGTSCTDEKSRVVINFNYFK